MKKLSRSMSEVMEVPADVTFEQAIVLTQSLLSQMEQGTISDTDLEQTIAALVQSMNGARGFFVTYLSDDRSLADQPTAAVVRALQTAPENVSELMVKNLVMSTAMAMTHRRNQNETMAQGSDRVRSRSIHLIQQLQLPELVEKAKQMQDSAATGSGAYQTFLDRWNYDAEQRQAMQGAIDQALEG
ncbi:MAG TPA: hypothetical protein V6D10_03915 [Trichocoleus sp.]